MNNKITFQEIKAVQDDTSNYAPNYYPLRYVSSYISYFFVRFLPFITPNQISILWGVIGLFSFWLISLGGYWNMVIGILVYHFAMLLDYVDGEVARATKRTTVGGSYLDGVFIYMFRGLMLIALGIGVYNVSNKILYLYLGIFSSTLLVFDSLNKLKVYETMVGKSKSTLLKNIRRIYKLENIQNFKGNFKQRIISYVIQLLRPNEMFSLSFFAIILNVPQYYILLMAFISLFVFMKNFIGIYKKIGNISS